MKLKTDRRQLSRTTSKLSMVPRKERKKNEEIIHSVQEFFYRDDVSTALPGKRDAKKVGKNLLQRRVLNDYLSNLYNKFIAENPSTKLSFSKFARMCPSHFKHTNFATQQSCLCTKHQNMSLKLKALKDLKIVTTTNPDTFVKNLNEADIIQKIANLACEKISFQVWKNVIVEIKTKSGDLKSMKKNKKQQKKCLLRNLTIYLLRK